MGTLAWHPECRSVGFATFANNTEYKQATLQLLDIDTGEWKRQMVPDIPYAYFYMEWSGDGKSVFYVNNGARTDPGVVERNLETAAERYIYKAAESYICWFSGLRLSRDRKRLVFHQMDVVEPGSVVQSQILSLDLETGLTRTIYSGKEPIAEPVWSPDGRNILVLTDSPDGGVPEMGKYLGILPAAGGPLKILKIDMNWPEGPRFRHGFIAPDWAPDGKEISFTARSMREEVFLMKNVISKDRR
jgi:Tol biopolymer transport system component